MILCWVEIALTEVNSIYYLVGETIIVIRCVYCREID